MGAMFLADYRTKREQCKGGCRARRRSAHLRDGKAKAYAVMAERRSPAAPEVPTIEEAGGPRLHVTTWRGLWAPKGTPADVVARLNRAVMAALADPDLQRRAA